MTEHRPVLSIVIPTFNRGARARALVEYLLPFIETRNGAVEVIVSNNCSTDRTKPLLESITSPYLRFVNQESFFPTAEEHIFGCLEYVNGDYVWFHGDDDITNISTLGHLLEMLAGGDHDFIIFNSMFMDINGGLTGGWLARINSDTLSCDFVEGACALGLTSSFAGISNAIQKTSLIQKCDWKQIVSQTAVYSHVAWWLQAFRNSRLTIVNRPIVMYRVDNDDNIHDHFIRHARSVKSSNYFSWTTGLMNLYKYLQKEGILSSGQIAGLFEFRRDGSAFRFLDNVMHMCRLQVLESLKAEEQRNVWSEVELDQVLNWLLSLDPGYFECSLIVRDMFYSNYQHDALPDYYIASRYKSEIGGKSCQEETLSELNRVFDILLTHKTANNNKMVGIFGIYRSFTVYSHLCGFVAFNNRVSQDMQAKLRVLDPITEDKTMVVASVQSELYSKIDAIEIRQDNEKASDSRLNAVMDTTEVLSANITAAIRSISDVLGVVLSLNNDNRHSHTFLKVVKSSLARNANSKRPIDTRKPIARLNIGRFFVREKHELAGFDKEYYLATNTDVAVSRLEPLQHFLRSGWKEGRDPSPFFSMKGYCECNPDVVASGINPYLHFLKFGINEQRSGWQVDL